MIDGFFANDAVSMISLSVLFLLLFVVAELMYRFGNVRAEVTRKIVHIGTGFLTFLFPLVLHEIWGVGVLCGCFFLVLLLAQKRGWLPSIHAIGRKSNGSLLYPLAVFSVFVFHVLMNKQLDYKLSGTEHFESNFFHSPIFILAICDPAAAFVGKLWSRRFGNNKPGKTWAGSIAFFLIALCIPAGMDCPWDLPFEMMHNPLCDQFYGTALIVAMALATTLAERFSKGGWDNLTIPAAAAGVYLAGYALV